MKNSSKISHGQHGIGRMKKMEANGHFVMLLVR